MEKINTIAIQPMVTIPDKKDDSTSNFVCKYCGKPFVERSFYIKVKNQHNVIKVPDCDCLAKLEKQKQEEEEAKIFKKDCYRLFPFKDKYDSLGNEHTFENFEVNEHNKKAYEYTKKRCFDSRYNVSVNLVGSCGSGKTRLMKTMLNERYKLGETCIFIEYKEFCDKIFQSFEKDSSESLYKLKKCLFRVKNLVFDDIGVGKNSPEKEAQFLSILNQRDRNGLRTDFTMNPDGEKNLSPRVLSRIKEVAYPIENNAPDYRPKVLIKKIKKGQEKFES